jgi:hypothetical protein
MRINKINMWVSAREAAKVLLGVNIMLLPGFVFTLMFILLEKSPDLYEPAYNATYKIQLLVAYSWFLALVLSPVLAIVVSLCFGYEIRRTIQWKISMAIMTFVGLPSLAFVGLSLVMRGI